MMSDYEILVLRELRKGREDSEEIAEALGLPEPVVRVALERAKNRDREMEEKKRKIIFTRESLKLLLEVLILYVVLNIIMLEVVT